MKCYFVRIPKDVLCSTQAMYMRDDGSIAWSVRTAKLHDHVAGAVGQRNTLPVEETKKKAEIWSLDDQKMKFEKLKL